MLQDLQAYVSVTEERLVLAALIIFYVQIKYNLITQKCHMFHICMIIWGGYINVRAKLCTTEKHSSASTV